MKPITKLNAYAFSISTSIVYYLWVELSKIFSEVKLLNVILTFVISIGFYRLIYKLALLICNKNNFLRQIVLGKYYLHGIWVGFYIYKNNPTVYYEIFDQTVESLTITGRAFDLNGKYKGSWTIIDPYISVEESKISYYYEMNEISEESFTLGYAKASIIWKDQKEACQLEGFAVDGDDTSKQNFLSIKTKQKIKKIVLMNDIYNDDLFCLAKELYTKNKNCFLNETTQTN